MKTSILSAGLLMCICFKLYAQQPIDQLIDVEKSFAAMSKEQTTNIAFVAFLDNNCVGYRNGEQINLFEAYKNRKEDESKLTWGPELAIIAASGELGVTTGPWEYRPTSIKDTPVAHGHFATVWKKKDNGAWKAVFDMGIDYKAPSVPSNEVKAIPIILRTTTQANYNGNWLSIDEQLSNNKTTLISLLAPDAWVSIQGHAPFKHADAVKAVSDLLPGDIQFKPAGYFVAESKDLLAVYGGVLKENKQEQAFLRVWTKKENEWRLTMMVIR